MSKQKTCQRFVLKIHSSRLRKAKWQLSLPLSEARRNDEVISLADSQILRWIDELNGITDADATALQIKRDIKALKQKPNSKENKKTIRKLYAQLDAVQFKPDYMELIIDSNKDYLRACRGYSINGISYKRLLGTNGGIKNNTIVFVSERHVDELRRRIANGRRMTDEFVPAKLEAYQALVCSASIPVSAPHGVLVVRDCENTFKTNYVYLNDEGVDEPIMELRQDADVTIDASDGFGLMSPALAERWSRELGLRYTMSGCCIRNAWTKGMVFTFDFHEFAETVAHEYMVTDVWGHTADIRNVELILTESQLKLWSSYDSMDAYLNACDENNYTFAVTKACPETLDNERSTNYQYIQCFDLNDKDIQELVAPTMAEIHDVLGNDWRKAVLFLCGKGITENNVRSIEDGYAKAMMIDPRVLDDPFVRGRLYSLIKGRINDAKIGVIQIHGNYSIASGDPYALSQSLFGLPVTGLLKSGEIYNRYWADEGAEKLLCFRAPMTSANNVGAVFPANREDVNHWYQYMNTVTILNAWDTLMPRLNGLDFDGDLVFLTDNPVLLRTHKDLPAVICIQRKAAKTVPTENDFVQSNIATFGNDIGKITNRATTMYELQSHFDKDSKEYQTLEYRIMEAQLFQQNEMCDYVSRRSDTL